MTCLFSWPARSADAAPSLILAAVRCRRRARAKGRPVLEALYETLDVQRCGMLAPVFASLLGLYEACLGREIGVGTHAALSPDEHRLLQLFDGGEADAVPLPDGTAHPGLQESMRIAIRSARIMIRLALEPVRLVDEPMAAGSNLIAAGWGQPAMTGP